MPPAIPAYTAMWPTFYVGDTLSFTETVPGYSAADGWVLTYRLVPDVASNDVITVSATASGANHLVLVTAASTASWDSGEYGWFSYVTKLTQRFNVRDGRITLLANPTTIAAGAETRSQAQKAVDDCLEALADIATTAAAGSAASGSRLTKRYVIGNREMEFEGTTDQIAQQLGANGGGLLSFWRGELRNENANKSVAAGRADRRRIYLQARRA
jgi:hypothetical protein